MKILKKIITSLSLLLIIFIPFQSLASTIPITPALYESSLSFPEASTDTSFTLVSNSLQNGVLPSGYTCFTIDQGQPNTEFECGTVSGTSVTGVTRGIDPITGNTSNSNLIFSHRRGADVKITDFPTLTVLSRILSQQDTIPQPITYAPGISPVSGQDLTTKTYVLSVVNGGPITYNQVIVAGQAGTTIAAGNLVYLNNSSGQWDLVSASTTSTFTSVEVGIAQGSATIGNSITGGILIKGVDTNNTGTAGNYAYAQNTAGAIGGIAGTNAFVVGQYITASGGLYFDPYFYTSINASQLAALVGSSGTPSGANKYLTQNSAVTTATAGAVSQLDGNGYIPVAQLGNVSYTSGIVSVSSGTQNIAHGLGRVPKKVTLYGQYQSGSSGSYTTNTSTGIYTASGNTCMYYVISVSGGGTTSASGNSTSYAISIAGVTGVVTVNSTNIIITWTGSPSGSIMWVAE